LQRLHKIKRLPGVGCEPVIIHATREELLEQIGRACAKRHLPFPDANGPVLWPRFSMRQALAAAYHSLINVLSENCRKHTVT